MCAHVRGNGWGNVNEIKLLLIIDEGGCWVHVKSLYCFLYFVYVYFYNEMF